MQKIRFLKTRNFKILLRSAVVTFYILFCGVMAVWFIGEIYTTMEFTAFGNQTKFIEQIGTDEYLIFGKQIYLPLVSWIKRFLLFSKTYCPGIIKLLEIAISKIKELADLIIALF